MKGKSKERKRDKKAKGVKDAVTDKQLQEDKQMLEEYEKLSKLSEAQRLRLKVRPPSIACGQWFLLSETSTTRGEEYQSEPEETA